MIRGTIIYVFTNMFAKIPSLETDNGGQTSTEYNELYIEDWISKVQGFRSMYKYREHANPVSSTKEKLIFTDHCQCERR